MKPTVRSIVRLTAALSTFAATSTASAELVTSFRASNNTPVGSGDMLPIMTATVTTSVVPEPATVALVAVGVVIIVAFGRRRRSR